MLVGQNNKVQADLWKIAPHIQNLEASIIREILKISSAPGIINFAGGLPAPELFPEKQLGECMQKVISRYSSLAFQYTVTQGIPELLKLLARRASLRATPTEPENILITSGAQQAIELIARAFIDPGNYVLTENPTYLGALQVFNYYQAKYATVEMDDEGMIIDQVEEKLSKYQPKLIYTVSNFQNPTGITMSEKRRIQLVELATRYNVPIVDDNPYGDIRFEGERLGTLKSFGGDGVIALRTFSKVISPGFRIGWINGPKKIIRYFEKVKQCADLHSNTFGQYLMYEFVSSGYLEPHIQNICADYKQKRDIMLKAMEEHFPSGVRWTHPEGGLFIWVELPKHVSAKELLPKAIEKMVAYVYGQPFYPNGEGENTMRINFCNATHENIREGIKRLGELLKENI